MQIGWSAYNKSVNRYTNINQRGTSGENIVPSDGTNKFQIYGSKFQINDKNQSFDYSSIANDNLTITDIQQDNFSVFGNYSGTSTRSTKPSLGWFDKGNALLKINEQQKDPNSTFISFAFTWKCITNQCEHSLTVTV